MSGQPAHAKVVDAYTRVSAACAKAGKVLGMGGIHDEENAARYIGMGARFVLSESDHVCIMSGGSARTEFLRQAEQQGNSSAAAV